MTRTIVRFQGRDLELRQANGARERLALQLARVMADGHFPTEAELADFRLLDEAIREEQERLRELGAKLRAKAARS